MPNTRVQDWLEDLRRLSEERFQLVWAARQHILALDPSITEEVKYGGVLFAGRVPFCGLFAYTAHVSLEFGEGATLSDPHGVLEGAGKHRRHIKLRTQDDLTAKRVPDLLAQAWAAATTR